MFGLVSLNEDSFASWVTKYDRHVNSTQLAVEHDYLQSSTEFIIPYVLEHKFQLTTFWVAPHKFDQLRREHIIRGLLDVMDFDLNRFFVVNVAHIWCVKKHIDGHWYSIDSITGISRIVGPDAFVNDPKLGFLMPWGAIRARMGITEMKLLVTIQFGLDVTPKKICKRIRHDLSQREPTYFGDCQTWIALFFRYLGFVYSDGRYKQAIRHYRQYIHDYERSPLDVTKATATLPFIITSIVTKTYEC